MYPRLIAVSVLAALALPAAAQEAEIAARKALMQSFATGLGVLGPMAQGRAPYDAAAAAAAASALHAATETDPAPLFPAGSAQGEAAGSRALPPIWDNTEDFLARYAALQTAAATMRDAAGTDLATLQGAMAGLAGACQACHSQYRGQ